MDQSRVAFSQKQNQLLDRAESLQFSAPTQALELAQEVQSLLQSGPPSSQEEKQNLVRCLAIITRSHVELVNYAEAILTGKQAIELGETIPYTPYVGLIYGLIGYANSRMGNYVDGLRSFLTYQQKASENNDRNGMAAAYGGRGLIYALTGELERSISNDMESLSIAEEVGDCFRQIVQLNNLCWNHTKLKRLEKAVAYGLQGLALSEGRAETGIISLLHVNVGAAYLQLADMANAEKNLALGLSQARLGNDRFSEMRAQMEFGRLYLTYQQPAQAAVCLEQALHQAMHDRQKLYQYEVHELLAQTNKALGNSVQALAHHEQFYAIRESVLNQQNQVRLATMEFEHELALALRKAELSKRQADELEEQIQARTIDLQAALARETELSHKLEQALQKESELQELKTRIINTASHEFRTPLSIIDLTTNLLYKRIDELSKDELETYRKRISSQVFYLKDMMQDVLTVNSTTSINPIYTSYGFADLCRYLQNGLATELQGIDRVSVHCADSHAVLQTDLALVQRVVLNLITNAIKFSDANSPVELIIEPTQPFKHIRIRVRDFGIGIPSTDLPHIFTMFYRASNIGVQSGLGLGLNVVHKIVSALQGTVAVESTALGQGSTFCVTLPFHPPNSDVRTTKGKTDYGRSPAHQGKTDASDWNFARIGC
ncbi:MAG: tetratricopeptide repeat-containing sensor histidine kinase [Caldilineaceae bacterium]